MTILNDKKGKIKISWNNYAIEQLKVSDDKWSIVILNHIDFYSVYFNISTAKPLTESELIEIVKNLSAIELEVGNITEAEHERRITKI